MRTFSNLFLLFLALGQPTICLSTQNPAPPSVQNPMTPEVNKELINREKEALTSTAQHSREYHLKAAFLRYVAKYVEWPTDAIKGGTLNICILGQVSSFQGINSINNKIVNDLTLSIKKILNTDESDSCQLVFVCKTEEDNLIPIIKSLGNKPILSFGDMDGFAEKGGAMNFYIANNRLAIMVNLPSIKEANLKINPQMLRLVTIVPPPMENLPKPAHS